MITKRTNVTQDDINNSALNPHDICPIERAARRVVTGKITRVSPYAIFIDNWPKALPYKALLFIINFDQRGAKSVKPFSFKITI